MQKQYWPLMDADEHRLKTDSLIGVYRRSSAANIGCPDFFRTLLLYAAASRTARYLIRVTDTERQAVLPAAS
jgi:hypothetical protein